MVKFNDQTLHGLFGAEAAEDETPERFKEYFFRNKAFDSVQADLPIRILVGHKGIGKSALLRMSYLQEVDKNTIALWLRPNDVMGALSAYPSTFLQLIEEWKKGLQRLIFEKAVEFVADDYAANEWIARASRSLSDALHAYLSDRAKETLRPGYELYVKNYLQPRSLQSVCWPSI